MVDRESLTKDLAREVTKLEADLRQRADRVDEVREVVEREWRNAHAAGRTAHDLPTWREGLLTQVAVAWALGTTFVRFCEDTRLLSSPMLAGPGDRARHAEVAQRVWFRDHAADGERGYVRHVFEVAATLPGLSHVFEAHNPVWLFGPTDDAMRALLDFWREVDPETGVLRRDFTDPTRSTRFLGDLYQDLSESARKQYALLQTPEFVESFILDRTLDPAIEEFGLDGFRMIDPACGSGHFLLGAFERLLARWQERAPQDGDRALAERALRSVFGIDLNPFAASIARFRLLVAALQAAGVGTLAEAPGFTLNIAVGDSLLHGPAPGQQVLDVIEQDDPASAHLYATEDAETLNLFLTQRYHAVVANPPYITPKDPAANAAYRRRYRTCHRQYALSVPFMERLFDLAERGTPDVTAGFVGQITANSFMKREFGKPLIEDFLARDVDLTLVADTSGAYIPGHGTPTVTLLGRNRRPVGEDLRAVLGTRNEPTRPADPASGRVWLSIVEMVDSPGFENEFVSVVNMSRELLSKHPWSLGGGGASELRSAIEARANLRLESLVATIGGGAAAGEDDIYFGLGRSRRVDAKDVGRIIAGDEVRDWVVLRAEPAVLPNAVEPARETIRALWPYKTTLRHRKRFGTPMHLLTDQWWEWREIYEDRASATHLIGFAKVSTLPQFVLRAEQSLVFKDSAPTVLLESADLSTHLDLLGLLNSSAGCFWMKQVFHGKGGGGIGGGIASEEWEEFFEFDGTKLKQFPIVSKTTLPWSERLDKSARSLMHALPAAVAREVLPTRHILDDFRNEANTWRAELIAVQEELDWRCLFLYGITDDDLSLEPDNVPPIEKGERAFEIVLARKMRDGEVETTWFERHGSTPITEIPADWPERYRSLVARRIQLIESDRFVGLVERPEYKRRWNWEAWEDLEAEALRGWLLDRLEDGRYWPEPMPRSAAQLADDAARDPEFVQVAQTYLGTVDVDLADLVSGLVRDESVPFLAAWRYTESGLRTREAWERTWALQRREDAGEDVGVIPVPPKYGKSEFVDTASWRLRGKLDVPKERFVAYPGLGRDGDPSPLVGWAGWDHLAQAQALAATYEQRRSVDGWESERLVPILAGLAELVPWLQQWHNEPDTATGLRLGAFFSEFVQAESAVHGVSLEDLTAWRPVRRVGGRGART